MIEATKRILFISLDAIAKARKLTRPEALKKAADYLAAMSGQWVRKRSAPDWVP
jgi:hypothetical protein